MRDRLNQPSIPRSNIERLKERNQRRKVRFLQFLNYEKREKTKKAKVKDTKPRFRTDFRNESNLLIELRESLIEFAGMKRMTTCAASAKVTSLSSQTHKIPYLKK